MATFQNVIVHIGLHKTATTFLQQAFFPLHAETCGYIDARKQMRGFLNEVLYTHDFEFDAERVRQIAVEELQNAGAAEDRLLISDEQFCGSPWDNAVSRKRYFDRLMAVFPEARVILVLRNQADMIRSLYLQYVKTGGTAHWRTFFSHKKHPLSIGLKAYLNYGAYVQYMEETIGIERMGCFFYEEMLSDPMLFLKSIAAFAEFEISEEDVSKIIHRKKNPSITTFWVGPLLFLNNFFKSYRHPSHLLPQVMHKTLVQSLARIPVSIGKDLIPPDAVAQFCEDPRQQNDIVAAVCQKDITRFGY